MPGRLFFSTDGYSDELQNSIALVKYIAGSFIWRACKQTCPKTTNRFVETFQAPFPDYIKHKGILFIHIPKAAGTSISMQLYGRQIGHCALRTWQEKYPHSSNGLFTFSIIREPTSRFISAFKFLKQGGMNTHDQEFAREHLRDFDRPDDLAKALIDPGLQREILTYHHFQNQVDYLRDTRLKIAVDLIIPLELLEEGLELLQQRTGVRLENLKMNKTANNSSSNGSLSEKGLEVISQIYKEDHVEYKNALSRFQTQ